MTFVLDTLATIRKLQAAGFSEDQAEAVTNVVRDAQDAGFAALSTKADIRESEIKLKDEIAAVRTEMRDVETRLDARIGLVRTDLRDTEARLDSKIDGLRKDVRGDNEAAKAEMVRWLFGAMGFQTIVMVGTAVAIAKLLK